VATAITQEHITAMEQLKQHKETLEKQLDEQHKVINGFTHLINFLYVDDERIRCDGLVVRAMDFFQTSWQCN